jgi:hypothetical protein
VQQAMVCLLNDGADDHLVTFPINWRNGIEFLIAWSALVHPSNCIYKINFMLKGIILRSIPNPFSFTNAGHRLQPNASLPSLIVSVLQPLL